jgi:hypothetical protein
MENLLTLARGPGNQRLRIYTWRVGFAMSLRATAYNVLQARAVVVGGVLLKELFVLSKPEDVELLRNFVLGEKGARDAALARINMGGALSKTMENYTRALCVCSTPPTDESVFLMFAAASLDCDTLVLSQPVPTGAAALLDDGAPPASSSSSAASAASAQSAAGGSTQLANGRAKRRR